MPQKRSSTAALDRAEDREDRLAGPLGARPQVAAAAATRSRRPPSSPATIRSRPPPRPASGGDRLGALVAEARADGVEQRPERRERRASRGARAARSDRRAPSASSSASSGSEATRNRGSPDWRVPSTSPSPRRIEIDLGELEAVALGRDRLEPGPGALRLGVGEEDAVGLVLAAADPPAQLVELAEAVAVGVLDHHHGRVGDVDPDLDHRWSRRARRPRRRRSAPSPRPSSAEGIWPCRTSTRRPRELALRRGARPRRPPPWPARSPTRRRAGRRRTPAGPPESRSRMNS